MKANSTAIKSFKPFTVNIIIESQDEAETLYALFNNEKIRYLLGVTTTETGEVRTAIQKGVGGMVNYHSKFDELVKILK